MVKASVPTVRSQAWTVSIASPRRPIIWRASWYSDRSLRTSSSLRTWIPARRRRFSALRPCGRISALRCERVLGPTSRCVARRTSRGRILASEAWRRSTRDRRDQDGGAMITSDQELKASLERIRDLQNQVAHLRQVETNPANYHLSASGFLAEIDRMQLEVREYLSLHPGELKASA